MDEARYAVYFAPIDQTALWTLGSEIIGYDSRTGTGVQGRAFAGLDAQKWAVVTAEPRRYGFHATLKAPFRLNVRHSESSLRAHFRNVVSAETAIVLEGLNVTEIDGFIALTLTSGSQAVSALAMRMVETFEPLRAPLSEADMARRMRTPLSEQQLRNLKAYGYPYVGNEFRFHMTLTGRIEDQQERASIAEALSEQFSGVIGKIPVSLSSISLLKQGNPNEAFVVLDHYRLPA